jgi:hypothetical protein
MHPAVWDAVVKQCRDHNVSTIRIPYEEWRPISEGRIAARRMEWLFFLALRRRCLRSIAGSQLKPVDRVYGHLETGRMSSDYLLDLLPRLGGRTNEVYFHPGTPHAAPLPNDPALDVELHALLDPRVKARIDSLGLRLTSFASIEQPLVNA